MRRCLPATVLALSLIWVAPALASDNGEGVLGETDDKIVTWFSLGVMMFFIAVVVLGSALQGYLERRKEARKAARLRGRTNW